MGLLPTFRQQPVNLADLYFNTPPPAQMQAARPTLTQRMSDAVTSVARKVLPRQTAQRLGDAMGYTPISGITAGYDAGHDIGQGNYLRGGLGAALAVLPIPGPKGGMFGGPLRSVIERNDNNMLPDAMNSLASFLRDPRPLHEMYDVGDLLTHKGEVGNVVATQGKSLVLETPSGRRIVARNDPDLAPAPPELWR